MIFLAVDGSRPSGALLRFLLLSQWLKAIFEALVLPPDTSVQGVAGGAGSRGQMPENLCRFHGDRERTDRKALDLPIEVSFAQCASASEDVVRGAFCTMLLTEWQLTDEETADIKGWSAQRVSQGLC